MKTIQPTFDWAKLDNKPIRGLRANTVIADDYQEIDMHDSDVDRMLEKGALEIDKTTTLSFAITSDKKFRISILEHTKGNTVSGPGQDKQLYVDMPEADLITLSKEFPEFVKKMEEINA